MGCRKQSGPVVKIRVHKRLKNARDQCLWHGIWKVIAVSKSPGEMPHIFNTVCVCVCVCVCVLAARSCLTLACQTPLSLRFPGQEYWSGLPSPSPGDLPYPGIKPRSPTSQADSSPSESPPRKAANSGSVRGAALGKVFSSQLHPSSS